MGYKISYRAGHLMNTPGKQSPNGVKEYVFNQQVCKFVNALLIYNGFQTLDVTSTGTNEDRYLSAMKSNAWNADVHLEIHHNAMGNTWQTSATGIEIWWYSQKGKKLAQSMIKHVINETKSKNRGIKQNKEWTMLINTYAVSVLPECGFMDNPKDFALMCTEEYQIQCAVGIAKGVCEYFSKAFKMKNLKSEVEIMDHVTKDVLPLVKEFQKAEGLTVDGIVGQNTWGKLMGYKQDKKMYKAKYDSIIKGINDLYNDMGKLKKG